MSNGRSGLPNKHVKTYRKQNREQADNETKNHTANE